MPSMGGSATLVSAPHLGDLIDVDMSAKVDQSIPSWQAGAAKYEPLPGVVGDGASGETITGSLSAADSKFFVDSGIHNLGALSAGDPAAVGGDFPGHQINGQMVMAGTSGMDGDVLEVNQSAALTAAESGSALSVTRTGALAGHAYTAPVLYISDTVSDQPALAIRSNLLLGANGSIQSAQSVGLGQAPAVNELSIDQGNGTSIARHTIKLTTGQVALPFAILDHLGAVLASFSPAGGVGLFGTAAPAAKPAITGALSTVADAPAKAVLTSIIAALVGCGLASNGTT